MEESHHVRHPLFGMGVRFFRPVVRRHTVREHHTRIRPVVSTRRFALNVPPVRAYNTAMTCRSQVQLPGDSLHGRTWILQLPELVRRESMVPTGKDRRRHGLPRTHGHLWCYTLRIART